MFTPDTDPRDDAGKAFVAALNGTMEPVLDSSGNLSYYAKPSYTDAYYEYGQAYRMRGVALCGSMGQYTNFANAYAIMEQYQNVGGDEEPDYQWVQAAFLGVYLYSATDNDCTRITGPAQTDLNITGHFSSEVTNNVCCKLPELGVCIAQPTPNDDGTCDH